MLLHNHICRLAYVHIILGIILVVLFVDEKI